MTPEQLRLSCEAITSAGHELSSAAKRALSDSIAAENTRLHAELAETRRLLSEVQAAFAAVGPRVNRMAVSYSKDVIPLALRVLGESPESCSHETIAAMSRINWDDVSIALPDEWKQALEN